MRFKDLTGQVFGRLTVIQRAATVDNKTMWLCKCTCGSSPTTVGHRLKAGSTKSCGCLRRENSRLLADQNKPIPFQYDDPEIPAFNHAIGMYIQNAKTRAILWNLSRDEAVALMKQDCHYCGRAPSIKSRKQGILYNGIDRKDSGLGYLFVNCVPCCTLCNRLKNSTPYDNFIAWIDRLIAFRGGGS